MDFKQIEAFVNVVRYKSFSKAADAMFFTQPTISTHVSNLENELGVKLLDRKGRKIEMTQQGSVFYKFAVDMVNAREQAVAAMDGVGEEVQGILEIQTSSIPGIAFLPEVIAEFRKIHSGTKFYVTLSDTQNVIDNLGERVGEIGFVGSRSNTASYEYTKLFSDRAVLMAPKSYNLGRKVSLDEILGLPFLWRESGSATRKSFEEAALALGHDKNDFDIAGLFNDIDSIVRSVEAGLGVSVISKRTAEAIANDKVDIIEIKDFNDKRDFYMVTLKNAALSPAAERFAEFVKEYIIK
ncbi:MAG: LysR family transcriptional regulator [Clostridiales bacterium]|nr:LysR family transcriptional regulator [Candidatus Crickella merdequi]